MIFAFADYEIDLALCELRRGSLRVAVQPKVFRVLTYLVCHRERVVGKQELFEALWPDESVGENSLTRAIRSARVALDDRGDSQRVIQTVRTFGYRFLPSVQECPSRHLRAVV